MSIHVTPSTERIIADIDRFMKYYTNGAPAEQLCEMYSISPQTLSQTVVPALKKLNYITDEIEAKRKPIIAMHYKDKRMAKKRQQQIEKNAAIEDALNSIRGSELYDKFVLACNIATEEAPAVLREIDYKLYNKLTLEEMRKLISTTGKQQRMPNEVLVYKAITPRQPLINFARKFGTLKFNEEQLAGLEFVLNRLPQPCAEILHLRYHEGLTYAKIAERLNLKTQEIARKHELHAMKIMKHPQNVLYIKLGKTEMDKRIARYREEKRRRESEPVNNLDKPLKTFNFTTRTYNALYRNNCRTLRDIVSKRHLCSMHGIGDKAINEVLTKLKELNIELK